MAASGRTLPIALATLMAMPAGAAEFSGYVGATTDYVWRGVTQSNGDPALQVAGDVNFGNGIYLGAWGSTIDIQNPPARQRDVEVNLYLGYLHDVSDNWRIGANVVAYLYPGATGDVDYDYVEYSLTANFNDQVWAQYSYSPDLYGSGEPTHNFDTYMEYAVAANWALGGGIGYYDVSNFAGSGYWYGALGVTRFFRFADVDLRFHDTSGWVRAVSNSDRVGPRLALTVRVPF